MENDFSRAEAGSLTYLSGGERLSILREWLAEIWQYRELLWFLAWRDIKVRYKQTVLGAGWAIIQPLLGMIVFTVFFGRFVGSTNVKVPYPIFSCCALVPWTYFSGALSQAGNSLVANSSLITKVYFPRVFLPASSTLSGLFDFLISSGLLVGLMTYYKIHPTWALFYWPLLIFAMWMFTLSAGMWLAALNVRYRDVKYTIPFLIQIGLFVTPVLYPITAIPPGIRPFLALNPMAGIIEGFRACMFPQYPIDLSFLLGSSAAGVILCFLGGMYFRATERMFADII